MKTKATVLLTTILTGAFFMPCHAKTLTPEPEYETKTSLTKDSMFEVSQETGMDYVLRYSPDRMLSPCYRAMHKTPKATTYGGWESRQIQGHMLGHYLSALSGFYYQTKNEQAKKDLDYTVSCIKELQRSDGYFGGIPSDPFDEVFSSHGNFQVERFSLANYWVPWYSVHKIYAGLIDAYTFAGSKDALTIVCKMADWAIKGTGQMTDDEMQKMMGCEHGGMLKVFADLYAITGEEKYLNEAERWIHKEIVNPLIKQVDKLQGYHANTQIPKIIGLARLYEVTGNEDYRKAVEFFFDTVTNRRSYVTGGNSKGEHFGKEYDETLARDTTETCNTYNMLELAEHIFAWNKKSSVADYYEKALYNHILASQDPDTGAKTYFVSTLPGFYKIYCTHDNAMWCCTGTGLENPERYNRFIAKEYDGTLYVNLFIPSTITTKDGWKLQISTSFPYEQSASIKVLSKGSSPLNLKVRTPSWVQSSEKTEDGYRNYGKLEAAANVTVNLPMSLNIRRARDRSGNFSILYGPIVLAADMGTKNMPNDIVDDQLVYMNMPAGSIAKITADLNAPEKWIEETDAKTLTFQTKAEASENGNKSYTLKPFFATHHVRYSTYFPSADAVEDKRNKAFENITVDFVEPGRQQSEMDHRFKTENTELGYMESVDRNYRTALKEEGFVSYRVKFNAEKENKIVLTVYGKDTGSLKVEFDGQILKTAELTGDKGDSLYDIEIPVSLKTLKAKAGKNKNFRDYVTVTLSENVHLMEFHITN